MKFVGHEYQKEKSLRSGGAEDEEGVDSTDDLGA